MRVVGLEKNGTIEKDGIKNAPVRKSSGTEDGIIPAARDDPVVSRIFLGVVREDFQDIGNGLGVSEIWHTKTHGTWVKVDVAVGEARENNLGPGIDDSGANAAHALDLLIPADGNDLALADGDTLGPLLGGVQGEDLGVKDDDVGGGDARRLLGRGGGGGSQNSESQYK